MSKIFRAITDGGCLHVTQKSRKAQKEAITDGDIWGSPRGEKLYKNKFKIEQEITAKGPSQMADISGSPEGEKLYKNKFKILQNI